jgi:hypothetical protein
MNSTTEEREGLAVAGAGRSVDGLRQEQKRHDRRGEERLTVRLCVARR